MAVQIKGNSHDGYLQQPYLCAEDGHILKLVDFFRRATLRDRDVIQRSFDEDDAFTFIVFAERMATWGVRSRDVDAIRSGLAALALEGGKLDIREDILVMAPLYHSATKIGGNADVLFEEAATLAQGKMAEELQRFPHRPANAKSLTSMGYIESSNADGFLYQRTW